MVTSSRLIFFLLTCFHLLGLIIFLKGFLLTRQTLNQRGKFYTAWDRFPLINNDTFSSLYADASFSLPNTVPSPPPFKRAILLVIDALRFDFLIQDDSQHDKHYRNHLPIIHQLQQSQRDNTLLFQFRADPPTTTMQRIKGLMTGSLPTFIDAGSNFASSSVEEDHLLHHLAARYPALYFMGDDTWQHLFPAALAPERTFASDSFKMFDLHTVDNRIQNQLWPLLDGTSSNGDDNWQVLIAHFLGVDHCGHTYGPDHTNMATKLEEMNSILTRIVEHVDEDSLLVVMGDHGMSVEGDHGGESVEELMSGLLLYSGRPLTINHHNNNNNDLTSVDTAAYFDDLIERMHDTRSSVLGHDTDKITQRLQYNASAYPIIPQIHLVPTLSYLLQLPIPFGNLGALIPDVLLHPGKRNTTQFGDDAEEIRLERLLHMAQQFRMNALQVYDYLNTYGVETHHIGFTKNALEPLVQQLGAAEEAMTMAVLKMADGNIRRGHLADVLTEHLESSIFGYDAFLSNTIKYCEAIWAQFDVGCMLLGIVMLGTTTIVGIIFWISHANWPQLEMCNVKTLMDYITSFGPWNAIGLCALGSLTYIFVSSIFSSSHSYWQGMFDKMGWIDGCASALGLVMMMILVRYLRKIQQHQQQLQQRIAIGFSLVDYDGWVALVASIIQALTLGSNSFVVWEDRGTIFVAMTLCICWILRNGRTLDHNSSIKTWTRCVSSPFLVMLWIRLGGLMGQCREEQYPYCNYVDVGSLKQLDTGAAMWWTTLLAIIFGLLLVVNIYWVSITSRYLAMVYGSGVMMVYIRIVDDTYQTVFDKGVFAHVTSASSTYELVTIRMVQTVIDMYMPRYVYAIFIIGSIYLWYNRAAISAKNQLCLSAMCLWSMLLALLQQPPGGMVVLLCPFVVHILALGDDNGTGAGNNNSSIMIRLALIHSIGHHLFFVTAHQATFTSLPWHAAFIGFDDMHYYTGATLVTLSTLTGYMISWIGTWMIISSRQQELRMDDDDKLVYFTFMALLQYIPTFLSSIFVFTLRRHLMTWKIFAPRFLLQALLLIGTSIAHLISQL